MTLLSVHMAIANDMDIGQMLTYLLMFLLPLLLHYLVSALLHLSPVDRCALGKLLWSPDRPGLRGRSRLPSCPHGRGPHNRPLQSCDRQHVMSIQRKARCEQNKWRWGTHLSPFLWKAYQVGCCIKVVLRTVVMWLHALCHLRQLIFLGCPLILQANHPCHALARAQFDTDLFAVGVDNHASRCMGNNKRLFKNLILARTAQSVRGISKGLEIEGKGTLVLDVNDNTGKPHCIKIPNSLYLPGLRMCLLSPQHWAQEAGDNYSLPNGTRMENNAHNCILLWGQGMYSKNDPVQRRDQHLHLPHVAVDIVVLRLC
jgi:hypothetical protein